MAPDAHSSTIPVAFTFTSSKQDWQGGINYFRALFLALQADDASPLKPIAFISTKGDASQFGIPDGIRVRSSRVLDRMSLPWMIDRVSALVTGRPVLMNRLLRREGVSVLSHGMPTGLNEIRNAAWIPDFQHLHLPQFFQEDELRKRDTQFRSIIARSDRIIVSSESARRDLLGFSPEHGHKARVLRFAAIPPAVDPTCRLDLSQAYGIAGRYFYIPNQAWAHKNHLTAIEALARLKDMPDVSVVCSGSLNDRRNPRHLRLLQDAIERHGLSDRFRMLGMIPYGHIAELMMQAVAVINPSLFEGWSTTVEESKAVGAPIILSDIPVHREQSEGVSARLFPPLDSEALAQAMRCAALGEPISDQEAQMRLQQAQTRHAARMHQFSRDFAAILRELVA